LDDFVCSVLGGFVLGFDVVVEVVLGAVVVVVLGGVVVVVLGRVVVVVVRSMQSTSSLQM